jgi:hypothetical protein
MEKYVTRKCPSCNDDSQFHMCSNKTTICNNCKKNKTKQKYLKQKYLKKEDLINLNETKTCVKCEITKNIVEFENKRNKCRKCRTYEGKIWSNNNKEQHSKLQANWYQKNKTKRNETFNKRYKNDPEFKLRRICRRRILHIISKNYPTDKYIGCTNTFLKEWLQFCFGDNMTFENHGKLWHVDHVIPLDLYDTKIEEEQMIAFNWKNLSPETKKFNMEKKNKIIKYQINIHIQKLIEFHKLKNLEIPHDYIVNFMLKL